MCVTGQWLYRRSTITILLLQETSPQVGTGKSDRGAWVGRLKFVYATQQAVQWSQIWYNCLKVERAIVLFYYRLYLNSVNGILLPIIHKIDMHHHKLGKYILNLFAGPYHMCLSHTIFNWYTAHHHLTILFQKYALHNM